MKNRSAYATLNLRKGAVAEEIKQSYLQLVKRYDPERHTERFMVIQKAFEILTDPAKRAREDIIAFNPVQGRFLFTDEEKADVPPNQLQERIARLEQVVESGGDDESTYEDLILTHMQRSAHFIRRKLYPKAIESWERILQVDPTHQRAKNNLIFAYSSLAYSYAEHELYDEAIDLWVKASQMNPDDDALLHNLALACEMNSRTEDAERYWTETLRRWKNRLERQPEDEYLRQSILEVHRHHGGLAGDRQAGDKSPARAVDEFREILKIDPNDFEARYQLAASHMENQEWGPAVEQLKALIKKYPKNIDALNLMGWAQLNSGHIDPAFFTWRLAAQIDPQNATVKESIVKAHLELGKKCRDQGQYNSALKHFKSLLKILGARNPEVHFEIGTTYFMKGDRRAAYVELQSVLQLDPRNQAAKKMIQELRMR